MPIPIEQAESANVISQALGWILSTLWAGLLFLVSLIWKKHNQEIDDLKKAFKEIDKALQQKVDDAEFQKVEGRMREGIIDLHNKIERVSGEIYDKIAHVETKLDAAEKEATNRHIELLRVLGNHMK